MKKILKASRALLILSILTGCAQITTTNFVVLRDIPANPSFSVVPYNYTHNEVEFAHTIEEVLIQFGVRTVQSPTPKEVVQAKGLTKAAEDSVISNVLNKMIAEAITIEAYIEYADLNSDYIVFSDWRSNRLRIIKVASKEILASFEIPSSSASTKEERTYNFKKVIHDGLKSMGINVRDLPEPPKKAEKSDG